MINNGRFDICGGHCLRTEMTLRQWISRPGRVVDRVESLHIFRQILDVVDVAHQQSVIARNIRPSCFVLSPCNRVAFIDSAGTVSSSERSSERSTGRAVSRSRSQSRSRSRSRQPLEWQGNDEDSSPVSGPFESTSHFRQDLGASASRDGRRHSSSPLSLSPDAANSARWNGNQRQQMPNEAAFAVDRATVRISGANRNVSRNEASHQSLEGESNFADWTRELENGDNIVSQPSASGRVTNDSEGLVLSVRSVASDRRSYGIDSSSSDRSASQESRCELRGSPAGDGKFPQKQIFLNEQIWYTSPEESSDGTGSFASDIYRLGVLLFELLCTFSTDVERVRVMGELRHRVLPPRLLSELPKEAAFCLRLLHPEPTSRPSAREVQQCELLKEVGEALSERQAAVNVEAQVAESDLLLDFLLRLQHDKQDVYVKMCQDVRRLTFDIEEIERRIFSTHGPIFLRNPDLGHGFQSFSRNEDVLTTRFPRKDNVHATEADVQGHEEGADSRKSLREEVSVDRPHKRAFRCSDDLGSGNQLGQPSSIGDTAVKSARLMSIFPALEKAYFGMRWKSDSTAMESLKESFSRPCQGDGSSSALARDTYQLNRGDQNFPSVRDDEKTDWLGCFFDGLCKYARYSRFEVKATLRYGDLLNTANMVCSLSFDRDEEYFATAGVCKRIKIFECNSVMNEHGEIHYPLVEMATQSKLSSVCWNGYIKNHVASSDYDGTVRLWDACTSQTLMLYEEHEKRAWSVDFSRADPMKLASGSDDGCVKLWSINQESSIGTIKTKANVCCVQFPPDSSHLLVFGSADYKIYCYDLRSIRAPLSVLASHRKAVSYVKFVDTKTLVSASTDNSLKLWDLTHVGNSNAANVPSTVTYTGHSNERNFVGLSVADGYLACGSEKNSVFAFHKSMPMPIASHRFRDADPVTGQEIEESSGQFVSSVCWRGKSKTLVAGNSMGMIKILELV